MEDFAPSVIVKRDGVEVTIPMDEFWAMREKGDPDEAPASSDCSRLRDGDS